MEATVDAVKLETICIGADPHGDHGYDPPLREIEREVSLWFEEMDLNIDYDIELPFRYKLQVEVHRIPIGSDFIGVKSCRIPKFNTNVLELRVRPPGSTHQWQVFLIPLSCYIDGKHDVFSSIFKKMYPDTASCVDRYKAQQRLQVENYRKFKNTKLGKELRNTDNLLAKHINDLCRNGNTKKMCFALNNMFVEGKISNSNLYNIICDYIDYKIQSEDWYRFLHAFMLLGLMEPTSPDNDDFLHTTALFDEYVAEVQTNKEIKEQQQKEQIINSYIETIRHNGTIKKLCYAVNNMFDAEGLILNLDLHAALSEFLDYDIQSEDWNGFSDILIALGIIETISDDNNDIFHKTELFDEYVKDIRAEKLAKEIQQIDREIGELMLDKDKIEQGRKAALKMLSEQNKLLRRVKREIREATVRKMNFPGI